MGTLFETSRISQLVIYLFSIKYSYSNMPALHFQSYIKWWQKKKKEQIV